MSKAVGFDFAIPKLAVWKQCKHNMIVFLKSYLVTLITEYTSQVCISFVRWVTESADEIPTLSLWCNKIKYHFFYNFKWYKLSLKFKRKIQLLNSWKLKSQWSICCVTYSGNELFIGSRIRQLLLQNLSLSKILRVLGCLIPILVNQETRFKIGVETRILRQFDSFIGSLEDSGSNWPEKGQALFDPESGWNLTQCVLTPNGIDPLKRWFWIQSKNRTNTELLTLLIDTKHETEHDLHWQAIK